MSELAVVPPPEDCPCEALTYHYKGVGFGHGPVADSETIAMVVFENLDRDVVANRLTAESFNVSHLKRTNLSLLRRNFTPDMTVMSEVVLPSEGRLGDLVGLACADAGSVRISKHGDPKRRIVCLIDKVEPGDHDGHASMGFSDVFATALEALSAKNRGIQRGLALATLAEKFAPIVSLAPP